MPDTIYDRYDRQIAHMAKMTGLDADAIKGMNQPLPNKARAASIVAMKMAQLTINEIQDVTLFHENAVSRALKHWWPNMDEIDRQFLDYAVQGFRPLPGEEPRKAAEQPRKPFAPPTNHGNPIPLPPPRPTGRAKLREWEASRNRRAAIQRLEYGEELHPDTDGWSA